MGLFVCTDQVKVVSVGKRDDDKLHLLNLQQKIEFSFRKSSLGLKQRMKMKGERESPIGRCRGT